MAVKAFQRRTGPCGTQHHVRKYHSMQFKYPKPYKHALICPVPKVNPPNDIDNDFRQISVLPQLAKILEKLQLSTHFHSFFNCPLIFQLFIGKISIGRSTVSALACISQKWFNATDNSPDGRMGVHALYLDFRKAFDMVDHGILLRKLAEFYINKNLWLWIQSFLDGRSQQVKLNSFLSTVSPCPAGVPQAPSFHRRFLMCMRTMLKIRPLIRWRWAHTNMQMTASLMSQLKKVM